MFNKWMEDFKKTDEYKNDSFHWSDMSRKAYNAGLQRAIEVCGNHACNPHIRSIDECIKALRAELDQQ